MSANQPTQPNANALYYGDNLGILREHIKDESVDLVYLDPPFNSARDYNVLFASPKGKQSEAQIVAFKDSWHWEEQAEHEYSEIVRGQNTDVALMIKALRQFLGENDMMAYLVMMTNRLLELHRAMKQTGSLYLHCDRTASHYLKIVLDAVFGKENFRSEIVWKRRTGSSSRVHESTRFQTDTDSIFFYAKSALAPFTPQYTMNAEGYSVYLDKFFKYSDANGRKYRLADLANPSPRPNLMYEYKGYKPPKNGWAISLEKMQLWDAEGRLYFPANKEGRIQRKRFLDEVKGKPVQGLWDDIEPIGAHAAERLGYPTQKPLALLERIVNASSREGDVVLDPFCGCGTAVHAAQKLKRQWIGIDITHLAITLIEKRLKDAFPEIGFEVHGTPKDLEGAMDLARRDKYQFQWWACSLVNAQPYQGKKKGADGGIDGLIFFLDDTKEHRKIVVSVKGGDNVSVAMVRDLIGVLEREEAEIGLFITLTQPTRPMITEAVKAGYYTSTVTGKDFRKLQILTIAGLLSGNEKAEYPDLARGATTFKKARVEAKTGKQGDMF